MALHGSVIFQNDFSIAVDYEKSRNYKNQSEAESAVLGILSNAGVIVDIQPTGQGLLRDGWECDGWRITFRTVPVNRIDMQGKRVNSVRESFDYFTGIGHRLNAYKKGHFMYEARGAKPVLPHVAGVLHSLLLDSESVNQNFTDWCADFGYSDDSLKALETYRACTDNGKKLNAIFPRDVQQAIREALADY